MDHGALDHPLKAGSRFCVFASVGDQVFEFLVDIVPQVLAQSVQLYRAGAHHGGRIAVVDKAQKEVLEGRIFVVALVGSRKRTMERLFEIT
jgi:hypothetical protein